MYYYYIFFSLLYYLYIKLYIYKKDRHLAQLFAIINNLQF